MSEYETQNKLFLEELRKHACRKNLSSVVRDLTSYLERYPKAKGYIIGRLPAILLNNYIVQNVTVDEDQVLAWTQNHPEWDKRIKENATDVERLQSEIAALMISINSENGT